MKRLLRREIWFVPDARQRKTAHLPKTLLDEEEIAFSLSGSEVAFSCWSKRLESGEWVSEHTNGTERYETQGKAKAAFAVLVQHYLESGFLDMPPSDARLGRAATARRRAKKASAKSGRAGAAGVAPKK